MAAASGVELVTAEKRDRTCDHFTRHRRSNLQALESGATNIIIGIGGSATNDGGAGMAAGAGPNYATRPR
ncbi:glycerate kinase [Shigella flexneri]